MMSAQKRQSEGHTSVVWGLADVGRRDRWQLTSTGREAIVYLERHIYK
jgi:hypothetical protein